MLDKTIHPNAKLLFPSNVIFLNNNFDNLEQYPNKAIFIDALEYQRKKLLNERPSLILVALPIFLLFFGSLVAIMCCLIMIYGFFSSLSTSGLILGSVFVVGAIVSSIPLYFSSMLLFDVIRTFLTIQFHSIEQVYQSLMIQPHISAAKVTNILQVSDEDFPQMKLVVFEFTNKRKGGRFVCPRNVNVMESDNVFALSKGLYTVLL